MTGQPPTVAVAHSCEGAGHATRMLAIGDVLEEAGLRTVIAGGGPGAKFVAVNGHREYEPRQVDLVRAFQDGGLLAAAKSGAVAGSGRVRQYRAWFARERPALVLADDVWAAIAAVIDGRRYVYVSHDPAAFYATGIERTGARVRNYLASATADRFLFPKVWRGPPSIPGAEAVPPIAPPSDGRVDDLDVLVVPSTFTVDPDALAAAIEDRGRRATLVGTDLDVQESLQPFLAGADLVVCSGYSTVMESAVAGTPCIVLPATSEQYGVAEALSDTPGFYAADSIADVEHLLDRVEPPEPYENGAYEVADVVTARLPDPQTRPVDSGAG